MKLHPGPPTKWVCLSFYGGHLDGERGSFVEAENLKGKIECSSGTYQLQGFRTSSEEIHGYAMDYAVYEWEPNK